MRTVRWLLSVCILWSFLLTGLHAQIPPIAPSSPSETPPQSQFLPYDAAQPIKVGFYLSPPFVMKSGDRYTGMAIDLWEAAAAKLGLRYEYRPFQTTSELLRATAAGDIDIAVSNLTISSSRMLRLDFTQPWYDSGLRAMIKQDRGTSTIEVIERLEKSGYLHVYFWLATLIIGATILLTLLDRLFDPEFPHSWVHGLSDNFYHVICAISSGRTTHKPLFGAFGRLLSAFWLLCGVAIIAYITSSIASTMTTASLRNEVGNISDLARQTVGVVEGDASENTARTMALTIRLFPNMNAAVAALIDEDIDAILGDAPVLEYYDNSHPELPLTEVRGILKPEKYGFALKSGHVLTHSITAQLVEFHENGLQEKLRAKYFGITP